jgi:hypothetical protein
MVGKVAIGPDFREGVKRSPEIHARGESLPGRGREISEEGKRSDLFREVIRVGY